MKIISFGMIKCIIFFGKKEKSGWEEGVKTEEPHTVPRKKFQWLREAKFTPRNLDPISTWQMVTASCSYGILMETEAKIQSVRITQFEETFLWENLSCLGSSWARKQLTWAEQCRSIALIRNRLGYHEMSRNGKKPLRAVTALHRQAVESEASSFLGT